MFYCKLNYKKYGFNVNYFDYFRDGFYHSTLD